MSTSRQYTKESITADLRQAGVCNIPGVGKLVVKDRAARPGRNPATGEAMTIPAKKVVAFSPSQTLKDAINSL